MSLSSQFSGLLLGFPNTLTGLTQRLSRMGITSSVGFLSRTAQAARAHRWGEVNSAHHVMGCTPLPKGGLDVEVLISAHGYRKYIESAVASAIRALDVLGTNGYEGGVVMVEDHGGDGSWEWAMDFAARCHRPFRLIQPQVNVGLTAVRNLALFSSSAKRIFILDADNEVCEDGLLNLLNAMNASNSQAAYGALKMVNEQGDPLGWLSNAPPNLNHLLKTGNHIDAMAMFDLATLKKMGGYDPIMLRHGWGCEDYDLWLRLLTQGRSVEFVPDVVVGKYLVKKGSMSLSANVRTSTSMASYFQKKFAPDFTAAKV